MEITSNLVSIQNFASPEKTDKSLSSYLATANADFQNVLQNADKTAVSAMMGEASPHEMVEALAQAQLAVETAVVFRQKVIEAYQEIMRMPV